MLRLFFNDEVKTPLDEQIEAVLDEMKTKGVDSEEYPTLMTYLERLNKLKRQEKRQPASFDTWIIVGGNFLIALTIVAFEQKHVMSSKALNLIRPGKV